jgi:hypothetical protein
MRQLTRGVDTSDCVSEETEAATFHTPVGEEGSLRFSKMQLSISNAKEQNKKHRSTKHYTEN